MIKRVIYTALSLLAMSSMLVSCWKEELHEELSPVPEGYVSIRFSADIPAMQEVVTRSVDPDGDGVQNMTLFCFDSYGLFITTATATIVTTTSLTGTFDAVVPDNTRTIHFVANQIMDEFKEDHFRNRSESEVMALLEGSSGRMIYWSRFACDPEDTTNDIKEQIKTAGGEIKLIRNHAQVSIDNPTDNEYIEVTGFVAYNTNAFGTVAPYHPKKGFDFVWPSEDDPFVTLPQNDAKMSDVTDVTTATHQYIFESENSSDDPVSIIIRGHAPNITEELYYRVMLIDENGEQLLIRRNHHYKLNIVGALSYGQKTFAEAVEAAATNNVWISISDEVNEVEDQNYILTVEKTNYILSEKDADGSYTLYYTITGKNGTTVTDADEAEISWIDNNVARQGIEGDFNVVNGVGQGSILINLLPMGENEKLEGTLLVKKGRLQRKIKVILIKEQSFAPSWVGTQVYGTIDQSNPTKGRSHVTVMFTIPETCPAELFPMNVLISVNDLDIRSESGQKLPVVRAGDRDWYSSGDITTVYKEESEPDYKYLYTVEKAGVQRVYFENILSQTADYSETLYIEAEHFETMAREFTFSDSRKSITVEGLKAYTATPSGNPDEFAKDEYVLYRLVPQKKGANVQFDLQLREKTGDEISDDQQGDPFNAEAKDEFLLYSQYLDYYEDGDEGKAGVTEFDCTFYPGLSETWWNENNPAGGRMLMFKPRKPDAPTAGTGKYSIYMCTNRAVSAEVVRIASNLPGYPAVSPDDTGNDGKYGGNSYRSVTFELANYNPFRFGARVNYAEGGWLGEDEEPDRTSSTEDISEVITGLEWTYEPDKRVDIGIDITSFKGSDGNSVDPFGEQFEIYIYAPMLTLAGESILREYNLIDDKGDSKLKADPSVPGRFIYTVAAKRDDERKYGTGEVENTDQTTGVDQSGERKILPFIVNQTVSAGDIVISSNEEKVVFYSKTFKVTNALITGTLKYMDGTTEKDVPADAFVSFECVRNGSRIGSMSVTSDGNYELRLRKEYNFNWYADKIELSYAATDGNIYMATFNSLADLFKNTDILLEKYEKTTD